MSVTMHLLELPAAAVALPITGTSSSIAQVMQLFEGGPDPWAGVELDTPAAAAGDKTLGKIMAAIAGDEARHEKAYIKIVDEFFKL